MDDETLMPSLRWSWPLFIMRLIEIVANVFLTVGRGLDKISDEVAQHHNWQVDQRVFADEAREDIENIPTQEG